MRFVDGRCQSDFRHAERLYESRKQITPHELKTSVAVGQADCVQPPVGNVRNPHFQNGSDITRTIWSDGWVDCNLIR